MASNPPATLGASESCECSTLNKTDVLGHCVAKPSERPGERFLPMIEGKLIHQFDHRCSTYAGATQAQLNVGILPQLTAEQKADPSFGITPRYWILEREVFNRLAPPTAEEEAALEDGTLSKDELLVRQRERSPRWLLGFRDITNSTNERTCLASCLP